MKSWTASRLEEIAERITDGSHSPPKGRERSEYLMLSSKNVLNDELSLEDPRYLSESDFRTEDKRTEVRPGDVLLTIVGTIGRSAVVPSAAKRITLQRSVAVIRPKPSVVDSRFLMYFFHNSSGQLEQRARGVAQKGLYLESLRTLNVEFPPLLVQKRIVGILDKAFAAVATAKANTEKNLQNVRSTFQSQLEGVFRAAWGTHPTVKLSEIASDITDGDHLPPPKSTTGIPFITIGNIAKDTRTIDFFDTFMVPRAYFENLKANRKPRKGDVLYTVTGSFGIPVLVENGTEFCFQRHIGLVRPNPETDSRWLYYLLLSPQIFRQAEESATGAAQRTVSLRSLRSFRVPRIPISKQRETAKNLDSLLTKVGQLEANYQRKSAALDDLKKSLLHEAFNGCL